MCSFVTYQTFFETREIPSGWLERCAWRDLEPHVHLLDVAPITRDEFLQRQSILAAALDKAGVDAFIAEPSASSSYYANISTSFDLSERPFLMIIDKNAQFSYLAPKFEVGRISRLEMVYEDKKASAARSRSTAGRRSGRRSARRGPGSPAQSRERLGTAAVRHDLRAEPVVVLSHRGHPMGCRAVGPWPRRGR